MLHDDADLEESGLQITGLRTLVGDRGSTSKFSSLFASDSSDDSLDEIDEDDAGRDNTLSRPEGDYEDYDGKYSPALMMRRKDKSRRPSTTEAKERTPLDDDDPEEGTGHAGRFHWNSGEGPFADHMNAGIDDDDSSDDDDDDDDGIVEIRSRRTS